MLSNQGPPAGQGTKFAREFWAADDYRGARMKERWALVALGAWLMGSVAMIVVATKNFHLVDQLLQSSGSVPFRALLRSLGAGALRDLLRYLSSELNRTYFLLWTSTQLLLALACRLLAARDRRVWLTLALIIAGVELALTPWITQVGRTLDFVPHEPPPPELATFWKLHVFFTVADVLKLILVVVAVFALARTEPAQQPEASSA